MKFLAHILAMVVVVASFAIPAQASEDRAALVVGDSISAWYNDTPGSQSQAWWSFVGRAEGVRVTVAAEAGSGYWSLGNKCQGTNFNGRLNSVTSDFDSIIVAGGFNDTHGCSNGKKVPIKRASTEKAIDNYINRLATKVDSVGIDRADVHVFTPWGTMKKDAHYWIWRKQKEASERVGFTYHTVRFLDEPQLRDSIHPNLAGSEKLAERFLITGGLG